MKLNNSTLSIIPFPETSVQKASQSTANSPSTQHATTGAHATPNAQPRRERRKQERVAKNKQKLAARTSFIPAEKKPSSQQELGKLARKDLERRGVLGPPSATDVFDPPTSGKKSAARQKAKAPQVAGMPATPSEKVEEILPALISAMRDRNVDKVFVAERHALGPENVGLLGRTVQGALQSQRGAEPMSVHRELNFANQDPGDFDQAMRTPMHRASIVQFLLENIGQGIDPRSPDALAFTRAMSDEHVSIERMSFGGDREDLSKFLDEKDFAVASLGMAHALYEMEKTNHVRIPWSGFVEKIPVHSQSVPPLTPEQQTNRFDGFERARQGGGLPAVVMHSKTWSDRENRLALHAHYSNKGLVVMEVPLNKKYNATILAPPEVLPLFKWFTQQHPGTRFYLLCKGIDGCEEKPIHDEL